MTDTTDSSERCDAATTEDSSVRSFSLTQVRAYLIWVGAVGMPFAYPAGDWLIRQGAVHASRFLLVYWVCALVWAAAITHWMLDFPEVPSHA